MPTYEAELSDGRVVTFESDHQPNEKELLDSIGGHTEDNFKDLSAGERLRLKAPESAFYHPSTTTGGRINPLADYATTMESVQSDAETPLARIVAPRQQLTEPRVNLPRVPLRQNAGFLEGAAGEAINSLESVPEFFTSDAGILSLMAGKLAPRLVSAGFSGELVKSAYDQAKDTIKNWGTMTPGQKGRAVASTLMTGLFGVGTGAHAIGSADINIPRVPAPPITTPTVPTQPVETAPLNLQLPGDPNAINQVVQPGSVQPKRAGDDASRTPTETGVGGGVRPTTEVQGVQTPSQAQAPNVTQTTPPVPEAEMPTGTTDTGLRPAIRLVGGKVVTGDAGEVHADIIKAQDLKATDIDQRGFVGPNGEFLDREQAAQSSGQPTMVEPGRLHSTDLPEAKTTPAVTGAETPTAQAASKAKVGEAPPTAPAKPSTIPPTAQPIGMGGALAEGEIGEGTALKKVVADMERQSRGFPEAPETVRRKIIQSWNAAGEIMAKDPKAVDNLITRLEDEQSLTPSDIESAMLLRRQVDLQNALNDASERTFTGKTRKERKDAQDERDKRSDELLRLMDAAKFKASESGKGLRWQQVIAKEDYSVAAMDRELRTSTKGKRPTEKQQGEMDKRSKEITQAESDVKQAGENLNAALQGIDPRILSIADRIVNAMDKAGKSALERIKARRAEGRLTVGLDPEDLIDHAIYGASKIARGIVEMGKWAKSMQEDLGDYVTEHLPEIWERANKIAEEQYKKEAPDVNDRDVVKRTIRQTKTRDADKAAQMAAWRTVRLAAIDKADKENKDRVAQAERDVETAKIQRKAAEDAQKAVTDVARKSATDAANKESKQRVKEATQKVEVAKVQEKGAQKARDAVTKRARDEAIRNAKEAQRLQNDPLLRVWTKAREYLEDNEQISFEELKAKVGADLGMKPDEVGRMLAQDNRVKRLADDLWSKQRRERLLKAKAKMWIADQAFPGWSRIASKVPRYMFAANVFGHGFVALGTHAPALLFEPRFWGAYLNNFGRMYKFVLKDPAFYESKVRDLMRSDNWAKARRFGLENDPRAYEEFADPNLKGWVGRALGAGNRGYGVLKFLRQDMFDQMWKNLPKESRNDSVGEAMADVINHVTGITSKKFPGYHYAFFAPRLEASRLAWLYGDPFRAVGIVARWKDATPGEQFFARHVLSERLTVLGVFSALLAANQGFLSATGSKQKINFTDPTKSDFLKFKAAGENVSYGNPILTLIRLPLRASVDIWEGGSGRLNKTKLDESLPQTAWEYLRQQQAPLAGMATDLITRQDPLGRTLWNAKQPMRLRLREQGIQPYTPFEFFGSRVAPIPVKEIWTEIFRHGMAHDILRGQGLNDKQISALEKAITTTLIQAGTGARISEDLESKR